MFACRSPPGRPRKVLEVKLYHAGAAFVGVFAKDYGRWAPGGLGSENGIKNPAAAGQKNGGRAANQQGGLSGFGDQFREDAAVDGRQHLVALEDVVFHVVSVSVAPIVVDV